MRFRPSFDCVRIFNLDVEIFDPLLFPIYLFVSPESLQITT